MSVSFLTIWLCWWTGEQSVKVLSIHASIHLPYLHMSMHNLSAVVITIHEMSFLDRGSILIVINKAAKFFLLYLLIIWWHIFIFLFFVKSFNNAYTSASVQLQPIIPYAFTVNKYLRVHLTFLNMLHTYFLNFFFIFLFWHEDYVNLALCRLGLWQLSRKRRNCPSLLLLFSFGSLTTK